MDLSAWIIAIFYHRTPFKSQLIHRSPVELIEVLPDAQLQNRLTHELEVCEWEGVLITIAENFRKTSSTCCYISVFSTAVIAIISEFLLKHWLYLMYVKRDVLTCSILGRCTGHCLSLVLYAFLQMGIQSCILMLLVTLSGAIYTVHIMILTKYCLVNI